MRLHVAACMLLAILAACGEAKVNEPAPDTELRAGAWMQCVRESALEGVELESVPGLDLEIEGVRVVTGALGQRGPEVEPPEDALRFAAVGGELTFGVGLAAEEAWPQAFAAQLSHSMLSGGKAFSALNLGTPFASTRDVLGIATQRATTWKPRLMVVELDASALSHTTRVELVAALKALREAAGALPCGVLVVVSQPFDSMQSDDPTLVANRELILNAADRAGLEFFDLVEAYRARPPAGPLVAETGEHRLPYANAQAQGWVLEMVKQRLFHTGLLNQALGSH